MFYAGGLQGLDDHFGNGLAHVDSLMAGPRTLPRCVCFCEIAGLEGGADRRLMAVSLEVVHAA
jgi:hypothetical protein